MFNQVPFLFAGQITLFSTAPFLFTFTSFACPSVRAVRRTVEDCGRVSIGRKCS